MLKRMKGESGSVTIEATISLTAFMFAIVTLLTIVNICMVQARVAVAINTTAKELSQYSYLYALTGFNKSEAELAQAAKDGTQPINDIMANVNTVFNEIENLGNTGKASLDNTSEIAKSWEDAVGSGKKIQEAGSSLKSTIEDIAKDPKQLMFGIAKLAASESLNLVKSRLIAAPLSKTLCKKHLVNAKDGDVDAYLKQLGVVPAGNGSYIDGLDFSNSTLFPYGSNEITVDVSYDVKVIALLPIDFQFHFHHKAVTHGWLAGESTYKGSTKYIENDTLWTKATVQERASLIRHMVIADMKKEGYKKTAGLTDVPLYSEDKNEFIMISSMNPLYSPGDEDPKTLEDLSPEALREAIERLCGKMKSTTDGLTEVEVKAEKDGQAKNEKKNCGGASNKIILVIPEDEGLKERIEEAIKEANTRGVTIEVVPSYGNGANATAAPQNQGGQNESSN